MMTITATKYTKGLSVGNDLDEIQTTPKLFTLITRPPPGQSRMRLKKHSTQSADVSIRSDPGRVRDGSPSRSYMDNLNPAIQICGVAVSSFLGICTVRRGRSDIFPLACDP